MEKTTAIPDQASTENAKSFTVEKEEPKKKADEGACASNESSKSLRQKPQLGELHIFSWTTEGKKKKIRVIKRTCAKWKKLGDVIGFDPGYPDALHEKTQGDPEKTCREIFYEWLVLGDVESNYDMSWEGVIELLDDVDQHVLANKLKEALQKK